MKIKKLFVLGLLLAAVFITPVSVSAQSGQPTIESLQRIVAQLQAQLSALLQQWQTLTNPTLAELLALFTTLIDNAKNSLVTNPAQTAFIIDQMVPVADQIQITVASEFGEQSEIHLVSQMMHLMTVLMSLDNSSVTADNLNNLSNLVLQIKALAGIPTGPTPNINQPPSISGVSGPVTLQVGQSGTWTVRASDPENGPLSYSVKWGDENTAGTSGPIQQTATFTHTYSTAGTYNPTFIVTDNTGQSVRTSLSVRVGEISSGYLYRFTFPGPEETMLTGQYYTIKWKPIVGEDDPVRNTARYELVFYDNSGNPLQSTVININDWYFQNWLVPQATPSGKYHLAISRTADGIGKGLVAISDNFQVLTSTPPQPIPTITSSNPPTGAIVAQKTSDAISQGLDLVFSGELMGGPDPDRLDISSSNSSGAPTVSQMRWGFTDSAGYHYNPTLSRPLVAGEHIRITHFISGSSVCLGYLPGDVDGSGVVNPSDQLSLIDAINGVKTLSSYSTDIDRNGVTNPTDILALVDGFNAGWLGKTLPACPGGSQGQINSLTQLANTLTSLKSALQSLLGR